MPRSKGTQTSFIGITSDGSIGEVKDPVIVKSLARKIVEQIKQSSPVSFFPEFRKFFNMKNCETINSSVVLIDKNNIVINNLANTTQQPLKINNPFVDLANKIVLNNAYNVEFQEKQSINNINRNFTSEKYDVNYDLFPARFQIISKKKKISF